ncbi:MAG TPA: type II toxin-antitoxin system prevent-host-death family antitoxin [Solirubrobacterales bacterium]|nr:type II toxin-antitoxin system prevent-host-death family antitoxin [Solirubrobacterales bacterium]
MREIGVRELKSGLSAVLREIEAGEQVRVTVHGRPVAYIVPVDESSEDRQMRELITAGRVTPASKKLPRNVPLPPPGKGSGTAAILADREEER